MNIIVKLIPLEYSDREQFILDNQKAFNYGAMEEFGLRDNHFEEDGQIISRETIEASIDGGEAYRIKLHPEVKVWETVTPYFEQRNIHFYVNRCGFHVVEFFNKFHPDPNDSEPVEELEEQFPDGMFRFEKVMQ